MSSPLRQQGPATTGKLLAIARDDYLEHLRTSADEIRAR